MFLCCIYFKKKKIIYKYKKKKTLLGFLVAVEILPHVVISK